MIKTMRLLGVESLLLHIERGQLSYFGLLIRMPLSGGFPGRDFQVDPEETPRHWRDIVQSGVEHLWKKPADMVGEPATAIQTQMSVIWIHLGRNSTSLAVSAVSQTFSSIHSFGVVFISPTGDWKLDVIPSHPARVAHYIKHIFNF